MTHRYSAEDYCRTLGCREYIADFRDAERFMACCEACGNYGRLWACPPFDASPLPAMLQYEYVTLFATRITPVTAGLPLSESSALIRQERVRIERRLRELETQTGGRAYAFAGSCLYCPEGRCSRIDGEPCRHPDLVRPSLEAVGFDIGKTAKEVFGLDLLWSSDGMMPQYLILVSGLFHNTPMFT